MARAIRKPKGPAIKKKQSLPDFCRSLPNATEDIKWGKDLVFSIGGKMFAVFDSGNLTKYSFKTTPEKFPVLTATDGLVPAPYAARFYWVAVIQRDALSAGVARQLIGESYELVAAGLPAKVRKRLGLVESGSFNPARPEGGVHRG